MTALLKDLAGIRFSKLLEHNNTYVLFIVRDLSNCNRSHYVKNNIVRMFGKNRE